MRAMTSPGSLAYRSETDRITTSARISGFLSSYSMFGIDNSGGGSVILNPDRNGKHGAMQATIGSGRLSRIEYGVSASLQQSRFTSDLFSSAQIVDPTTERVEKRASLSARLAVPLSRVVRLWFGEGVHGPDWTAVDWPVPISHTVSSVSVWFALPIE